MVASYLRCRHLSFGISRFQRQKVVRACTIRLLDLETARHEEVAIYEVNQRIPNGWRIAGAKRSNP